MGFDATTQEGVHINSVHFTTENDCCAGAVDELAGGTASDYAEHICNTIDSLSQAYCHFTNSNFQDTRKQIINNIKNTMTDRCASNHAALQIVCSQWKKNLNELNCHLHPLDSFASATRVALKKEEKVKGKVFGDDCIAANVIVQINKVRYKDGKGDPRGFVSFLDKHNLPRCILPRYRGNRLHILFHISAILIEKHNLFSLFFSSGTSLGKLRGFILDDFSSDTAKMELVVLGLIGKMLTAQWMKTFYTSAADEINHAEGINVVRQVLDRLKVAAISPDSLLTAETDFFGQPVVVDAAMSLLRQGSLHDIPMYVSMMKSCLEAIISVIIRQYSKYFTWSIDDQLREETKSARSHNIDAENIMGMFSALKKRTPNATLCYLSCQMRAKKNRTVQYLDNLDENEREVILQRAVSYGRKQRNRRRLRKKELTLEMIKRQEDKKQKKNDAERKNLEKKLKSESLHSVLLDFPEVDGTKLSEIMNGEIVGQSCIHVWYEDGKLVSYNGKIEKLRGNKKTFKVSYWSLSDEYDDATDYEVSVYALASDFLYGDLHFLD